MEAMIREGDLVRHPSDYCPSWVCAEDRLLSDPERLATLNCEQRIIMRSYPHPHTTTPIRRRTTSRSSWTGRPGPTPTPACRIPLRLGTRRTAAERFTTERGGDL